MATLLLAPPLDTPRRILVPFAGTGSEMIGAHLAGWDEIVGVEREAEYCAINRPRVTWWSGFTSYDDAIKVAAGERKEQVFETDNPDAPKQLSVF